jgi:hypothetical protein
MKFARSTAYLIRGIAIVQLLTVGLCFVPESGFADLYAWAGLGHMPHLPFLRYVIRGASYCQGAIGVLLWIVGSDVVRYRPLVIATGAIYLAAAPAFWVIHVFAGMPRWWAVMDTAACFLMGAALLVLCLLSSSDASAKTPPGA